ncbi:NUDIX hydrolase [Lutibacter flavus]|uniref:NUDIX domain-containing protein n=1 Tax=Lutibacter flavus TaxID=691689 RepID=A0A238VCD5_9FLAO|nr:CoA pyrophosphatase [Lutibacter flavus]SNR31353.1 NUDIX domain-containing protein [Lutibacter flavus]
MEFSYFKKQITKLSNFEIGGLEAQFKLAPKIRKQYSEDIINSKSPKKAAVLVIFYPDSNGKLNFLLTHRASYNGTHSAQISFPGGKFDVKDKSLKYTALREANEEVGIKTNDVSIFKQMTDVYIPPSNFIVTPFLSYLEYTPQFIKNYEVEVLIEVTISDFLNDNAVTSTTLSTSYANKIEVPCFILNNYIVWGATAMMLSEIKELINKIK